MNETTARCRILLLPFAANKVISLNFQKALENQRKTVSRGFFERQYFYEVIIDTQESALAFEVRFAKIVVKERVVLEADVLNLAGREIQNLLQNAKGLLFVKKARATKSPTWVKKLRALARSNTADCSMAPSISTI